MLAAVLIAAAAAVPAGGCLNVVANRLLRGVVPPRYPAAALGLALLWAITVLVLGADAAGRLALGLALCAVLLTITLTDLAARVIPNLLVLVGAALGVAIVLAFDLGSLDQRALAVLIAGGATFALALACPGAMGMGDAKLVAMIGIYLGRAIAPVLLIGFAAGAVGGIALIARHGLQARRRVLPFGPFLALGGVIGLWFGDAIVDWYVDDVAG